MSVFQNNPRNRLTTLTVKQILIKRKVKIVRVESIEGEYWKGIQYSELLAGLAVCQKQAGRLAGQIVQTATGI